ncbi:MAG: dihydrolipoyl dehydrogenase [Thermodesulfobacteriota bacterium]|nr:dihydrolipoyl dehydrogenase [Thermodesulfobacteriota bacterium]
MARKITVIGSGPGGYIAAIRAAQLGGEVTLIEKESVGGTCLNWGCIPSKILIHTAKMLENFRRAEEFGIRSMGSVMPDLPKLMDRKEKVIKSQAQGINKLLEKNRIQYLKAKGFIEEPGRTTVKYEDGNTAEISYDGLILAIGSYPISLSSIPFDGDRIISSNEALSLRQIPQSILIVGGGVIGCEFAFVLAALGCKVTVVEALSRMLPLPSVDEDCSKILQREMKKRKIKFLVNRSVESVEDQESSLAVTIGPSPFLENISPKDEEPKIERVEKILVCVGRKPSTDHLGLENIGVHVDEKGWVIANEKMETNIAGVYAIGDVLGPAKVMLAHVASAEGLVAAENAMQGSKKMDYTAVPGAIFTTPEIANVGLTESQAKQINDRVRSDSVLFRAMGKAQVVGEIAGMAKIVSDVDTGRILGVHIVGSHATDLIAEGTLAIKSGSSVKDLAATIHAHPTFSEVMQETSFKALDRSLHG